MAIAKLSYAVMTANGFSRKKNYHFPSLSLSLPSPTFIYSIAMESKPYLKLF